jgi:3',5'-cyclic AMP phosphodiesterase CpdA
VQVLPDNAVVALLADWGGDNDAAKTIAAIVRRQKPDIAVHLGDIYYGGTKLECEIFLDMWPLREDINDPKSQIQKKGSFALNGNHEMYSGGEYYFNTVLPAFGQPQPFFCLENQYWRILGLDTAYAGGRLKPQSEQDPIAGQWNWLFERLRSSKKANILLTHHQPVSAHHQEWMDSTSLRNDATELLNQVRNQQQMRETFAKHFKRVHTRELVPTNLEPVLCSECHEPMAPETTKKPEVQFVHEKCSLDKLRREQRFDIATIRDFSSISK